LSNLTNGKDILIMTKSIVRSTVLFLFCISTILSVVCHGFSSIRATTRTSVVGSIARNRPTSAVFVVSAAATTHYPVTASTVIEEETTTTKEDKTTIEILKDDDLEDEKDHNRDGWEIRLWNDPFNKREFVARCLSTICNKSDTESYQIMMQAHKNGYVLSQA
jgi:ATP-dependent Clp protease adapter protein ClpS